MLRQCHVQHLRPCGTPHLHRLIYRFPGKLDVLQSTPYAEALDAFIRSLTERSIRARFHGPALCDPEQRRTWIAKFIDGINDGHILACFAQQGPDVIGIAEAYRLAEINTAEFSLLISDAYQGRGIGGRLLQHLEAGGRLEGIDMFMATIDDERDANEPVRRLLTAHGYRHSCADAVWAKRL
jgi:GNAT superfamily N-acetyltransferase